MDMLQAAKAFFFTYRTVLQSSFVQAAQAGVDAFARTAAEKKNGDLASVYISWLRVAVINGQPLFQLDFYDSRGRVSPIACAVSWDLPFLQKQVEQLCPMPQQYALDHQKTEYEVEQERIAVATLYFTTLGESFLELIPSSALQNEAEWYYGEYFGAVKSLGRN